MKKVLSLSLTVLFSAQAFANADVEKISALSAELGALTTQLSQAESDRNSAAVKLVISAAAAAVIARYSHQLASSGRGDIGSGIAQGFGAVGYGIALVPTIYSGIQAYNLVVDVRAIPKLKAEISQKQAELEAAKRLARSLED